MEEGLFPHSRTLTDPTQMEEERRLCYVGMTRAMDTLVMTRARYRRRYGNDMPESSLPSRFLEEVPSRLMENLGSVGGEAGDSRGALRYGNAYATPYPQRRQTGWGRRQRRRREPLQLRGRKPGGRRRAAAMPHSVLLDARGGGAVRPGSGALDNTAAFFGKGGGAASSGYQTR